MLIKTTRKRLRCAPMRVQMTRISIQDLRKNSYPMTPIKTSSMLLMKMIIKMTLLMTTMTTRTVKVQISIIQMPVQRTRSPNQCPWSNNSLHHNNSTTKSIKLIIASNPNLTSIIDNSRITLIVWANLLILHLQQA